MNGEKVRLPVPEEPSVLWRMREWVNMRLHSNLHSQNIWARTETCDACCQMVRITRLLPLREVSSYLCADCVEMLDVHHTGRMEASLRKCRLNPTELAAGLQFTRMFILCFWDGATELWPTSNFLPLAMYATGREHNTDADPCCPASLFSHRMPWPHGLQLEDYSTPL